MLDWKTTGNATYRESYQEDEDTGKRFLRFIIHPNYSQHRRSPVWVRERRGIAMLTGQRDVRQQPP